MRESEERDISNLRHMSIKKFGSRMYSEPLFMFHLDVYPHEGNDMAKRLHYKLPLLGVEQCTDIFIILFLRQTYNTSKRNS